MAMDKKIKTPPPVTSFEMPEDLLVLNRIYSLPKLNYINITQQEQWTEMLIRWPLLAELREKI